jgi:hypothetical protein
MKFFCKKKLLDYIISETINIFFNRVHKNIVIEIMIFVTSFRHAARHASFVDVKISALSCPWIIAFGTLSKFHGLLHTLSTNKNGI